MQTFKKKRIDIVIEAPILRRLLTLFDDIGVVGYTVVPVLAGGGKSGPWQSEGMVGGAGQLRNVFVIIDEARVDEILEPVFKLVSRHIGIVSLSDVEVVRGEQFG